VASPSRKRAFMEGFLCNILNPKVGLFLFTMFTQVIDAQVPLQEQALYGVFFWIHGFLFWALLVLLLQSRQVQSRLSKAQTLIHRLFGVTLCVVGLKVAYSTLMATPLV